MIVTRCTRVGVRQDVEVWAENTKRPPFWEVEAHVSGEILDRERALAEAYYKVEGERDVHGHEYGESSAAWQRGIRDWLVAVNRIGVYPGSFNPPTRAHLEIALAARDVHRLHRVDLAVSSVALGKESVMVPRFDERLEVIRASVAGIDGIGVVVTEAQLIVDIAAEYHVVVMGADKWAQVNDPAWYDDDHEARDAAIARLPELALAPRAPHAVPAESRLPVPDDLLEISSSAARNGRTEWMTEAARSFDAATGAWTEPHRYR